MSQTLTVHAEKSLNKFCSELAKAYQVEQPALVKMFSVVGPMETTLRKAILASVEFLGLITCMDVDHPTGQVVQVGVGQLYTGRKKGGRFKGEVGVDGNKYELKETDSCASLLGHPLHLGKCRQRRRVHQAGWRVRQHRIRPRYAAGWLERCIRC